MTACRAFAELQPVKEQLLIDDVNGVDVEAQFKGPTPLFLESFDGIHMILQVLQ